MKFILNIASIYLPFVIFIGPCPYIAEESNDRIIRLDIAKKIYGEYLEISNRVVPFTGTINQFCQGNVTVIGAGYVYRFEYDRKICKIKWSHGRVSTKYRCP